MKRYHVCAFPSLLGTPWKTNSWLVARVFAWWRGLWNIEARIADKETGEDWVARGFFVR
jgi:hypothetical protein